MFEANEDGIYQSIHPAAGRRILALGAYYVLGALLIWLAFSSGAGFVGSVVLIGFGGWVIYMAERMRRVTQAGIMLTTTGLCDTTGEVIAAWDDIAKVERGTFAIKPSNGFSLVLKGGGVRKWAPGLWWRTKGRVGVGGVLPGPQTRTMAEGIAVLLVQHGD